MLSHILTMLANGEHPMSRVGEKQTVRLNCGAVFRGLRYRLRKNGMHWFSDPDSGQNLLHNVVVQDRFSSEN